MSSSIEVNTAPATANRVYRTAHASRWIAPALLWLLFALICLGLGYPALKRYDPRQSGNPDANEYYALAAASGWKPVVPPAERSRPRLLVPLAAKAVAAILDGRTGSVDAVRLGLLVANSAFVAAAALLLVRLGLRTTANGCVPLLAATLYLLNFCTANLYLAGLIDSGEAFLLLALACALAEGRFAALPWIGLAGVLSKETFLPEAGAFVCAWWVALGWRAPSAGRLLKWGLCMMAVSAVGLTALWSAWAGQIVTPLDIAAAHQKPAGAMAGLWNAVVQHETLYVAGWLVPLGAWRLSALPRPWVAASLATAIAVLGLSALDDSGGNAARYLFTCAGPVFCLSAAHLLAEQADVAAHTR